MDTPESAAWDALLREVFHRRLAPVPRVLWKPGPDAERLLEAFGRELRSRDDAVRHDSSASVMWMADLPLCLAPVLACCDPRHRRARGVVEIPLAMVEGAIVITRWMITLHTHALRAIRIAPPLAELDSTSTIDGTDVERLLEPILEKLAVKGPKVVRASAPQWFQLRVIQRHRLELAVRVDRHL